MPNLTPDVATGLGGWSDAELREVLRSGLTPEGDFVGGAMAEVVRENTSRLTEGDRAALAAYLRSLPPRRNDEAKPQPQRREEPEW